MKKLMFLALTLAFTTYSAASSATQFVSDFFTGSNATSQALEQQGQNPLVLDKYQQKGDTNKLAYHYSHSSHASHASHASHFSHYSSRY